MKTTVIDKVILVYFKDHLECVCKDSSTAIRFMSQWIEDRNLSQNTSDAFRFVERDVIKIRLR